jgi:hypothetical protein
MIWLLSIVVAGMAYRFVEAISMGRWSAVWYGAEILALALFIKSLMI